MGPKVEAALEFLAKGGKRVIVTSEDRLTQGIDGVTGTVVLPG
jgi:carbamate kinase